MGDAMFTARMAEDLTAYFSGALTADMGLRSATGAQLERAAGAAQSDQRRAPEWDGRTRYDESGLVPMPDQCMVVNQSHSGASADSTEAAEAALYAVRIERRVRATLARLAPDEQRALRAWFTPLPPTAPSGELAVVADRIGVDALRRLTLTATTKPDKDTPAAHRETLLAQRAGAKAEIAAQRQQARRVIERARSAYAEAAPDVLRAERDERVRKFAGGSR